VAADVTASSRRRFLATAGGHFGFETFSHMKSVMKRYRWGGMPIFPPYGAAWRWIERLTRGKRMPDPDRR
jgi:hypothetical protein